MAKILFICDPLTTFKLETDTTYLLMINAAELGYQVFFAIPNEVYLDNQLAIAITHEIRLLAKNDSTTVIIPWYKEVNISKQNLCEFKQIHVRNDPPFNMEYFYLTQILTIAEKRGAKIINNSQSLRNFNEKLSILNFPDLIAPTIVTKHPQVLLDFMNKHVECVIKPLDLLGGRSVFKISPDDVNCNVILENITNNYTQTVMLQKFIPEVIHGDKRIFIIHGQVISYCLYRIPPKNQIRGNIAAGGYGCVQALNSSDYKIANKVATWLTKQNIIFAGIDVIGDRLTEINITSPTGTRQILQQTGINIAKLILELQIDK